MASLTCYLRLGGPAAASGPEQLALTNHDRGVLILSTPWLGKYTSTDLWRGAWTATLQKELIVEHGSHIMRTFYYLLLFLN